MKAGRLFIWLDLCLQCTTTDGLNVLSPGRIFMSYGRRTKMGRSLDVLQLYQNGRTKTRRPLDVCKCTQMDGPTWDVPWTYYRRPRKDGPIWNVPWTIQGRPMSTGSLFISLSLFSPKYFVLSLCNLSCF